MLSTGDILVVDDDKPTLDFIAEFLSDEGYVVRTALNAARERAAITERRPDLVLLDLYMPGKNSNLLVQDLKNDGLAHVSIIMMTVDTRAAKELSMDGIAGCLVKPFNLDELSICVAKHIQHEKAVAA